MSAAKDKTADNALIMEIDKILENPNAVVTDCSEPMDCDEDVSFSQCDIKQNKSHLYEAAILDDQESKPKTKSKSLQLRNYQKELTQLAEKGKNVIISAPPGCGKTVVACHIIKEYLENQSQPKIPVLMFTPTGALASQQCTRLKEHLPDKFSVELMCGSAGRSSFMETERSHVVVLTPKVLLNELNKDEESRTVIGLETFGLLIFDECHRCTKNHPYNSVMKKYLALKNEKSSSLPQIVGLSATLGIGKTSEVKLAVEVVKLLCANLNALDGIVSVKRNLEELEEFTPSPEENVISMEAIPENEFLLTIYRLMTDVRKQLTAIAATKHGCPSFSGEEVVARQVLKQWCVKFRDVIAQREVIPDQTDAKIARTCVDFIELYIDVLDFFLKCRASDSLDHFQNWLDTTERAKLDKYHEQEKSLYESAKSALANLRNLDQNGEFVNPNLEIIKNLLSEKFHADSKSKGMLMVEMRKYAHALKKWLDDTDSLDSFNINAQVFTGTGNSSANENGSLTHLQQKETMDNFREGKHKLLICTPDSAGEGIDVTDCNFVIIYDIMTNEVSVTQIKGRARKQGGEIFQLCSERVARRECLNKRKTKLMETARRQVEQEIEKDIQKYQSDLLHLQRKKILIERIKTAKSVTEKSNDEYIFNCGHCSEPVCSSLDIRVLESTHYICIRSDFKKKYKTDILKKKKKGWDNFVPKYSALCDKCGHEWGKEFEWMGVVTMVLLCIKGFVLVSKSNSPTKRRTPKKWKEVPFKVSEITNEEREALLRQKLND